MLGRKIPGVMKYLLEMMSGIGRSRPRKEQGGTGRNRQGDNWEKVSLIRDKFEYDRERRMREKAFAPMSEANNISVDYSTSMYQAFDTQRYISDSDSDID
ncbi:hypothetical protein HAX54_039281 [Datura stramonium]|uniref:Uncharacterized protein n=1 Tax=Datura stramonium TaxID=4076 RepID=A0ABS8SJ03_DATST|nr:hypothetical protein [Datura stramonium]